MPDLSIESLYSNYVIVGIDEVGRGAWAGPLVAGAVIINQAAKDISYINDSKKMKLHERAVASQLIWNEHTCGIGVVSVGEINELGLNPATFLAIDRAIKALSKTPTFALIDGNYKSAFAIPHRNVIRGDSISVSIAAASVIAKVYRDSLMRELDREFSVYNWQSNVGYGTKAHMSGLIMSGISEHHRKNYRPIQEIAGL